MTPRSLVKLINTDHSKAEVYISDKVNYSSYDSLLL